MQKDLEYVQLNIIHYESLQKKGLFTKDNPSDLCPSYIYI